MKFYKTNKNRKLRYSLINSKKNVIIIFFHGFMSDMTGNKPTAFHQFCKKKKLGYLRFEYSGHGKSSDEFVNGNISKSYTIFKSSRSQATLPALVFGVKYSFIIIDSLFFDDF